MLSFMFLIFGHTKHMLRADITQLASYYVLIVSDALFVQLQKNIVLVTGILCEEFVSFDSYMIQYIHVK